MDVLSRYKINSRNVFERILFELEIKLGVTRGRAMVLGVEERFQSYKIDEITMKCNQLMTSIIYQERSQVFIKDLAENLRRQIAIAYYEPGHSQSAELRLKFTSASHEIQDIVENCSNLAVNTIHQTACLEKRAQNLINVVWLKLIQLLRLLT